KEVLSEDGWLNTGDLMTLTVDGELCFVGRSKDTIVLFGGENVEPTPIEEKLKESPYIDHCMVVGQDQKFLGALIVPNEEELLNWAKANGVSGTTLSELIQNPKVEALIKDELKRLVNANPAFKSFEKVPHFRLIGKPFEKGEELNNTLKLRRHVVTEKYKDLINSMYA
ncbi:MAG: long-chain fatty acid--CoA ligase, partial [Candidatus Hydrogenedentota bacterium]